ncbi:MAG TPA: hypothetical protein VFA44_10800 [Gaiellaceae bacterium]|nr:hypothetical protein [Gaiellaceae bacterium]
MRALAALLLAAASVGALLSLRALDAPAAGGARSPTGPALVFVDARHGWAAGAGGILATRDGGRSWRHVARQSMQALDAVDATHAWAYGGSTLFATADGVRWHTVSHRELAALDFVDLRHGFALDSRGRLLATSDRGVSWHATATPRGLEALCATPRLLALARAGQVWVRRGRRFALALRVVRRGPAVPVLRCRASSVWLLLEEGAAAGSQAYDVYRSLDGGRRWRRVLAGLAPTSGLPAIAAYSGPFSAAGVRAAAFVGSCAPCGDLVTVVATRDGGATWWRASPLRGQVPEAVSFPTPTRGWLLTATRRGLPGVWRTTDGGRSWRLLLRSRVLTVAPP